VTIKELFALEPHGPDTERGIPFLPMLTAPDLGFDCGT